MLLKAKLSPAFSAYVGGVDRELDLARQDDAEFVAGMGIGLRRAAAGLDRDQQAGQRGGRRRQQLPWRCLRSGPEADRRLPARTQ